MSRTTRRSRNFQNTNSRSEINVYQPYQKVRLPKMCRDTFGDYPEYVERLMREAGVVAEDEKPSAEERLRFDRERKGKMFSNKDWQCESDSTPVSVG